jgi:hypothetical protein
VSNRIRIEGNYGDVAVSDRVVYVTDAGEEIDISNCVTGYEIRGQIGEARRATLHVILVQGMATAEVEDVIVNRLTPKPHRWWRRPRDVTRMGSKFKELIWS